SPRRSSAHAHEQAAVRGRCDHVAVQHEANPAEHFDFMDGAVPASAVRTVAARFWAKAMRIPPVGTTPSGHPRVILFRGKLEMDRRSIRQSGLVQALANARPLGTPAFGKCELLLDAGD